MCSQMPLCAVDPNHLCGGFSCRGADACMVSDFPPMPGWTSVHIVYWNMYTRPSVRVCMRVCAQPPKGWQLQQQLMTWMDGGACACPHIEHSQVRGGGCSFSDATPPALVRVWLHGGCCGAGRICAGHLLLQQGQQTGWCALHCPLCGTATTVLRTARSAAAAPFITLPAGDLGLLAVACVSLRTAPARNSCSCAAGWYGLRCLSV